MRMLDAALDPTTNSPKRAPPARRATAASLSRSAGNLAVQDEARGFDQADLTLPQKQALERLRALTEIPPLKQSKHFPKVPPKTFVQQLEDRIRNPDALHQGKRTNFCWAAACMSYTYTAKPVEMVEAMYSLYTTGDFQYSSAGAPGFTLDPTKRVRQAAGSKVFERYRGLSDSKVDQMLFMSLTGTSKFRGFTNLVPFYYKGAQSNALWSGRSFGAAVRLWKALGFDIESRGASASADRLLGNAKNPGLMNREKNSELLDWAISQLSAERDIVLFISGPVFRNESSYTAIGTHFIRVRELAQDLATKSVTIDYWEYGHWSKEKQPLQRMRYALHGVISIGRSANEANHE